MPDTNKIKKRNAVKHAVTVWPNAWSELEATAAYLQGAGVLSGQNNGDCIEGPSTQAFYLAPRRQRVCILRDDMQAVCEWSSNVLCMIAGLFTTRVLF